MRRAATIEFDRRHARLIAAANGAPRGERQRRVEELTRFVCDELRRQLKLRRRPRKRRSV